MSDLDTPGITPPVVNLNGSPKGRLLEQHMDILKAIRALEEAMREAFPHGRDFQTAPPGTYEKARAQAEARFRLVARLHSEIEQIALAIADQ